jgi:hypothetical protein
MVACMDWWVLYIAKQLPDDVRRLLELRQQGAQAASRKLATLIASAGDDHRLRGTLRFHGASTGRWAGSRFQPQNLKKAKVKDIDAAVDAVRAGDLEAVCALGAPLAIVGDLSRSMICAAPNHVLFGADFSAIESRVLAWLAGEKWKLETHRRFDTTNDPVDEPYCVTASRILGRTITPDDETGRAIGKVCDLAFGFGGGAGAMKRFTNKYNDAEIERFKTSWRAQHAATVRFWDALEGTLRRAIRTGQRVTFKNIAAEMGDGTLYLILPSGRRLAYPGAHLAPGKFDRPVIVFKDNSAGGWSDVQGWRGTFTENVVQAVARDLLAASMLRLEAHGYQTVLHCHDEAVCEVPEGFGSAEEFHALMTALPNWADGLPLAAKAWKRINYAKEQSPSLEVSKKSDVEIGSNVGNDLQNKKGNGTVENKLNGTPAAIIPARQYPANQYAMPLADLIGQPLHNNKILCPFHADTRPSLHIYPNGFHCFSCGVRGDHLDWLMTVEGLTRTQALDKLFNWDKPVAPIRSQEEEDEKARKRMAAAQRIWDDAGPIGGTKAIKYLADVRGIDADLLPTDDNALRYHPRCPYDLENIPCLVALYRDVKTDVFAGIHRIALTDDVLFAGGTVQRRTLGTWPAPKAIKLWPSTDRLFLGEGIETVLAAATRLSHRDKPIRPAWAAGNANNITKFPVLANIKQLTLLVDHDVKGENSANACRQNWRSAGREVMQLRPKRAGADFNDIVLEQRQRVAS